jgi:hypothetical protein
MRRRPVRDVVGADKVRRHVADLLAYLERNEVALVHYAARRRRGQPIATSFVESAVDEIISWRMSKAQQMRWRVLLQRLGRLGGDRGTRQIRRRSRTAWR